jgi:hypothetical protein
MASPNTTTSAPDSLIARSTRPAKAGVGQENPVGSRTM